MKDVLAYYFAIRRNPRANLKPADAWLYALWRARRVAYASSTAWVISSGTRGI
jgi:hypothetical protein